MSGLITGMKIGETEVRVLWIEDFGGGVTSHALVPKVFANLLTPDVSEALAQTQARGGKRPTDYIGWRKWYAGQPEHDVEIDIYRTINDFETELSKPDLVSRYDAALLDVELSADFFNDKDVDRDKLGGLWAFGRMVSKRFPAHCVALLTAHTTKKELENFTCICRQRGLEEIEVIDKGGDGGAEAWLARLLSENDGFLRLRRGVLEGVAWAQAHLTTESIRLNKYLDTSKTEVLLVTEIASHLKGISNSMPVSVHDEDLQDQLHLYVRQLGFFWDRAKPNCYPSDDHYRKLGRVLQLLRNWSAHGQLLRPSVSLAAILSIAHLRTTIAGNDDETSIRSYEKKLLDAISASAAIDDNAAERLANSYVRVQLKLSPLVGKPSRLRDLDSGQPRTVVARRRFSDALNELEIASEFQPKFFFERHLLEVFIHDSLEIRTTVTSAHDFSRVEKEYKQYLGKTRRPNWVEEVWRRILSA